MTKLYDEVEALIERIEDAANKGDIKQDEIVFLAGSLRGASMRLLDKYTKLRPVE